MHDEANEIDRVVVEADEEKIKKSISMHENVPVWYDCCSCEAEPYWLEAMEVELSGEDGSKGLTNKK